jgi:uncharacterized membrane protein (DUF106 family)
MVKRFLRWGLIPLVLVLDVVTIFVDLFSPALRAATVTVLTLVLVLFAAVRLIDWRRMKQEEEAAFALLERQKAAMRGGIR